MGRLQIWLCAANREMPRAHQTAWDVVLDGSSGLEALIDKSIRVSRERGYSPPIFMDMRSRHGTVGTIDRLVRNGEIRSGFKRLKELGLLEWTIESAELKFADEFSAQIREAAQWRLSPA